MEKADMEKKIREEPDFIHAPKFSNSLDKFLAKSDNICENNAIGRLLMIPPEEVEKIYLESVEELRKEMVDEAQEDKQGTDDFSR